MDILLFYRNKPIYKIRKLVRQTLPLLATHTKIQSTIRISVIQPTIRTIFSLHEFFHFDSTERKRPIDTDNLSLEIDPMSKLCVRLH